MRITDISIHTKVTGKNSYTFRNRDMVGEIVSDEVKKQLGGGQFQVLVKYERESTARWVAGGNLIKIDW